MYAIVYAHHTLVFELIDLSFGWISVNLWSVPSSDSSEETSDSSNLVCSAAQASTEPLSSN